MEKCVGSFGMFDDTFIESVVSIKMLVVEMRREFIHVLKRDEAGMTCKRKRSMDKIRKLNVKLLQGTIKWTHG